MLYSKSITLVEEDLESAASAAAEEYVYASAEQVFIEELKAGDAQAFDLLITRFSADIYSLLCRLTGDPDEAGDLTQDTFLRAFRSIGKFRGESGIRTWLFRIAINESRNRFRWWKRRRREKTVSLDEPINGSDLSIHDTIAGYGPSPEELLLDDEYRRALYSALDKLPEIFREALVLFDIEGQSYREIASILEINIGTVKSRIARGREELRKQLRDY